MARKREFDEKEVVKKATCLFWQKGYNAVSTKDLIQAFGISRSSMYAAYHNKRNLFVQCLIHYKDENAKMLNEVLNRDITFIKKINILLKNIVDETLFDDERKGCFIVNTAIELAPHDEDILKLIQANRQNIINAYSKAIKQAIQNGELTKDNDPISLANYFYILMNGLRVDAKVQQNPNIYKKEVKIALSILKT